MSAVKELNEALNNWQVSYDPASRSGTAFNTITGDSTSWMWGEGVYVPSNPEVARKDAMPSGSETPKDGQDEQAAMRRYIAEQNAKADEVVERHGVKVNPTIASAFATQEGGDHYSKLRIQPMEYSMANGLDACQHTVIKYVTRFRDKGGIQDLRKAVHVLEMLIEMEGRNELG